MATKGYLYTSRKLGASTCERKQARVTAPETFCPHPFTLWTEDDLSPAIFYPKTTAYATVYRAPNNRATRREIARKGDLALASL